MKPQRLNYSRLELARVTLAVGYLVDHHDGPGEPPCLPELREALRRGPVAVRALWNYINTEWPTAAGRATARLLGVSFLYK